MNLMYLPALCMVLLFVLYPLFRSVYTSLLNWNGYSPTKRFVGMENYLDLLTDKNFRLSFLNTLLYGFGSTFLQNVLGLAFALFLNTRFKGHKVVRTIVYMPVMISGLIMGYIMYFVVRNHGALNEILSWFGIAGMDWMGNGTVGRLIITLVNSWQFCGFCMVIYMAGLQGISQQYYEAAAIDGANVFQRIFKVTIPMIMPTMVILLLMSVGGIFKGNFDLFYNLVGNNGLLYNYTDVIDTLAMRALISSNDFGMSAAIGLFQSVLCFVTVTIVNKLVSLYDRDYALF